MKNATPTEIANYITNTGCKSFTGSCPCLDWGAKGHRPDCTAGHLYIALTPFGLPSHLVPHNPAGLSAEQITEGGKWRCGTANDFMQTGVFEYWKNENTGWVAGAFGGRYALHLNPDFTYRLPADTPFPDWEEMSKAVIESEIPPPPINRCPSTFPHPAHDYCPGVPFGKRATVKESSTAQPATEDSSTPQPAPGETLTCPVCDGRSTKKPGLRCPECRGDESYIPYMKPAPGETPETDAYIAKKIKEHGPNWPKNLPETLDFAQNLERQRDQAIREVSEQGRRIGELESDLQQAYNARNRARMEEEQKWRPQLEAANADRVRVREALEWQPIETGPNEGICWVAFEDEDVTLSTEGAQCAWLSYHEPTGAITPQKPVKWMPIIKPSFDKEALSTPAPEMVAKEKYDADIAMMNERAIDRTSGMLDGQVRMQERPSAKSFRAGWRAANYHTIPGDPGEEESLRKHMAESEPKGKTLAELKGGEG